MVQQASFDEKKRFIIALGKALHKYGTPAYRLESHLLNVAEFLDINAQFMISPTSIIFVLWEHDDTQEYNHIARVSPSGLDLKRLAQTDDLIENLGEKTQSLQEALAKLRAIDTAPPPYSRLATFLAFCTSSGAFAVLMRTSWNDAFWSFLIGGVVCLFMFWSERSRRVTKMLEPLSALAAGILVCAVAIYDPLINMPFIILSSVIVFIPGLSLTLGLAELANRDLVAGTARIMDALMCLFKLYFGAVLGLAIGELLFGAPMLETPTPLDARTAYVAVPVLSASLVIMFQARLRDAPWGMLSGIVAFIATVWASVYLGPALSAFIGTFVLGIYANLFARITKKPALIVTLQGLVVLVPGSKVYIGLNSLIAGEYMLYDSSIGSQTFLIFMSLVAGLLFANTALPPKKSL